MTPRQTTEQEANAVNQKESSKKPKTTKENCRDPKDQLSAECKFCGYKHERKRDKSPAYGKTCSSCGKANHFAAKWAIQLCVGHTAILPSSEVRNLGRSFDNQLKMVTQINQTCKAAFFHIFNIRRIRKFLSFDTVQTLVNAFVISRLDYCNSIQYSDCLTLNCKNSREYKTLLLDLFATSSSSIILLQL